MKTTDRQSAFTLVELMVALLASSVLLLLVATILIITLNSWRTNNAYTDLRRDAAFAINIMARDIREAAPSGLFAAGTDTLTVSNAVRDYVSTYTRNSETEVLSLTRTDNANVQILAANVQAFAATPQNISGAVDGVILRLEMMSGSTGVAVTNETYVHMRN